LHTRDGVTADERNLLVHTMLTSDVNGGTDGRTKRTQCCKFLTKYLLPIQFLRGSIERTDMKSGGGGVRAEVIRDSFQFIYASFLFMT
jgi:hypothetical protein